MSRNAIVLTGGGARAAYQVGVMRALYDIVQQDTGLFQVITGNSAGAINAVFLAYQAHDWDVATQQLWDLWARLKPQDIFELGAFSIGKLGTKWISGAALGGKGPSINYLLNTEPLRALLEREVDFATLNRNIADGTVESFGISTTNYYSGSSVVFYNSCKEVEDWARTDRFSVKSLITREHIMGSSAIPLFFPPEKIGESWYGDGCVRQTTPLSPAIHLGAEKIIAVGIRAPHTHERQRDKAFEFNPTPTVGQIAGVLMNAVFLDALEADVDRLSRINQTLFALDEEKRSHHQLRPIPILMLRPSRDLGAMTAQLGKELPSMLRYVLKGIGVTGGEGLDLLSYLAFDKSYTRPLMELGYDDTIARSDEIKRFLEL